MSFPFDENFEINRCDDGSEAIVAESGVRRRRTHRISRIAIQVPAFYRLPPSRSFRHPEHWHACIGAHPRAMPVALPHERPSTSADRGGAHFNQIK
ncbi:hypothetical protein GIY62_34225 [Burkholderia plantarii]|uniref:hypothetical protein n=1 Tax=Burkholderia plantarii TaxID=41899 RepID=UPI00272D465F|nr:hypothetical protein [Burkholderia plantarii]WLE62440.1 hypothetical protein GIY62_34225 [Burkholderia plantarii]